MSESEERGPSTAFGGPPPLQKQGRIPRWVTPFLRALERTGVARAAAEDAGVDHTTAYVRRRTHAAFADAWLEALAAHEAAKKRGEEEGAAVRAPALSLPPLRDGCPSPAEGGGADGEELVASGNQLKRVSSERWGKRKEEAFLAELAVTGNLRIACKAVRISYEAVRKRRRNDPRLDAACIAAIAACSKRAPEFLASAMVATFDPEAVLDAEASALPRVSIDQAIKIAQLKLPPGAEAETAPRDIEAVRQRLEDKMRALNLIHDEGPERTCPHCRGRLSSGSDADEAEEE